MEGLARQARGLLHGLEAEIRLVLDAMLPAGARGRCAEDLAGELPDG